MGYAGKLDLKLKAQELRRKGWSVRSIQKSLQVSKSSVSLWIRGISLTEDQIKRLYLNKTTGGLKGSFIASRNKIRAREISTQLLHDEGKKQLGRLSKRDRFVAGIALYFAEGDKTDKAVGFSNSDPRAILFMVNWLREFCKVYPDKFRCNLYIHDNLDEFKAREFWSNLISIPLDQFKKSYIVKNNPNRFRKTKHQNGVLRVVVHDVALYRLINGWISGVFEL